MPETIFQTYLNRLTDLSTRNRSLYLPRLEGYGMIDLKDFDFLIGDSAFSLIRSLTEGKKSISLIPEVDPRSGDSNQLSKSLTRISHRDQMRQEESGEQSLHVAWLFAEGKLINGKVLRAPLLIQSVTLIREKKQWKLASNGGWKWNSAFLLAWRHAMKSDFEEELSDELLDEMPSDMVDFRVKFNLLIQKFFDIQVQSNLFEDQVQPFANSQISLDQERFQDGRLVLKPYAVLGSFSQGDSFLISDYERLNASNQSENLEGLFQMNFGTDELLPEPREENLYPVFPLDASQEQALIQVRRGRSIVVQGPPGTGKSQLIANLVSDFISRGKKVLVVSQKRAALDVVFERMDSLGFGPFLAVVHDFHGDRNSLFDKIRKQLDAIELYQQENRGMDSIQLEREIAVLSRTISRLSDKFEEFRRALFDASAAGLPIKALYLKAARQKPFFESEELLRLDWEQAGKFENDYRIFFAYQDKFKSGFWQERKSFAMVKPSDFSKIADALCEVEKFGSGGLGPFPLVQYKPVLEAVLKGELKAQQVELALDSLLSLAVLEQQFFCAFDTPLMQSIRAHTSFVEAYLRISAAWEFEVGEDLLALEQELEAILPKVATWWGRVIVQFQKTRYPRVFELLKENRQTLKSEVLQKALDEVKARIEWNQKRNSLPDLPFVDEFSELPSLLLQLQSCKEWSDSWSLISSFSLFRSFEGQDFQDFRSSLKQALDSIQELQSQALSWRLWLSDYQIVQVIEHGLSGVFSDPRMEWQSIFGELQAFDLFLENWDRKDLGLRLWSNDTNPCLEEQLSLFWNGWYLAWIGELERRDPVLSEAGSIKMKHEMQELSSAILKKRELSHHVALLRVREEMVRELEYNRLGNRLTYRELQHQVGKKRKKWSVRKVVEELSHELFRVLPCWLCSPETVSAVFPMEQKFDLVIFDEASQCAVEKGLPAMLRGKQLVVAGDSKQLRPADFYRVKWDTQDDGVELESESLLELAAYYFEEHSLRGHYRSADPALVHFSNQHFYEGKLEALPDYLAIKEAGSAFTWRKIDGVWQNQVNRLEAEAVVVQVNQILAKNSKHSIGVVTGNYPQMELIRELLWTSGVQDGAVKVRNIENVQGDEFDQVILSLGYAANEEGKLTTNFGLLGKSGAANRLNVAITRARKRMHVISSLAPEDFRPKHLQNHGLHLLFEFLSFAEKQSQGHTMALSENSVEGFEVEWSLKRLLAERNSQYSLDTPSHLMDLVEQSVDIQEHAILTDDQRFFNAPSAKSAMAYHPILLQSKHWDWRWKWSRELFLG